jgi:hypothetical protein
MRYPSLTLRHGLAAGLALLASACAGHAPAPWGAAAATVAAGPLPRGPSEPVRGLSMPSLDLPWTPPSLVAGDVGQLAAALTGHGSIALQLGPRFGGPEALARVEALVQALRPGAAIVDQQVQAEPFAGVALPLEREPDDGRARPRYRFEGRMPVADPHERSPSTASAVLVIADAELDPGKWRALPARAVGSCQAPMAALAAGQEQSLAELEPFLDHADATLWQVYRPALHAILPRLLAELEPYREPKSPAEQGDAREHEQHQCGHAYWQYLQAYARCGEELAGCGPAPRMFLMGGARIGTAEPNAWIPEGCAAAVGRDYVQELRTVATEAAQVAQEHLAPSWSALADRVGAITEVYETLEDVCTPRRRRFAEADLQAARGRLVAIGEALASDEGAHPAGGWALAEEPFHVPGYGPVQQVARYHAGPGSASETVVEQARALRELLLGRALCRSGQPELPLAVALVRGSGDVEVLSYFFEEELSCGELPPLQAEAEGG